MQVKTEPGPIYASAWWAFVSGALPVQVLRLWLKIIVVERSIFPPSPYLHFNHQLRTCTSTLMMNTIQLATVKLCTLFTAYHFFNYFPHFLQLCVFPALNFCVDNIWCLFHSLPLSHAKFILPAVCVKDSKLLVFNAWAKWINSTWDWLSHEPKAGWRIDDLTHKTHRVYCECKEYILLNQHHW